MLNMLMLFFCLTGLLQAQDLPSYVVNPSQDDWLVSGPVHLYEDASDQIDVNGVAQLFAQGRWQTLQRSKTFFSVHPVWLRFSIKNTDEQAAIWHLLYPILTTYTLDFFVEQSDHAFSVYHHGTMLLLKERNHPSRFPTLPLSLAPHETKTVYIKVRSANLITSKLKVLSPAAAHSFEFKDFVFNLLYVGEILTFLAFNLFVLMSQRKKVYVYYLLHLVSTLLMEIAFSDFFNLMNMSLDYRKFMYGIFYLFPFLKSSGSYIGSLFNQEAIQSSLTIPKFDRMIVWLNRILLILSVAFLLPFSIRFAFIANFAFMGSATMIFISNVKAIRVGYRPAVFNLTSIIFYIAGVYFLQIANFGDAPASVYSLNFYKLGSMSALILYSLGLADQYKFNMTNELKRRLVAENHLKEINRDLEKNIEEKATQVLETNKRGVLGEMAGGIAHEINSPLAAIYTTARRLARLVKQQNISPEEMKNKLGSIQQTVERLLSILHGLQNYSSQASQENFQEEDLQHIIHEAVVYCSKSYQQDHYEFEGLNGLSETKIVCNKNLLLFMIICLLETRIHTLKQSSSKKIAVQENKLDGKIFIQIKDGGEPVQSDIQNLIVNPFQERKGVMKGSGLKLGLIKEILDKHKGKISFGESGLEPKISIELGFAR